MPRRDRIRTEWGVEKEVSQQKGDLRMLHWQLFITTAQLPLTGVVVVVVPVGPGPFSDAMLLG